MSGGNAAVPCERQRVRRVVLVLTILLSACTGDDASMAGDDTGDPDGGSKDGGGSGEVCTGTPTSGAGQATYYDADGTGNCSFPADPTFLVAAMNTTDYGTATYCGACVSVTGPSGSVVVRIVDRCPGCAKGDLDLSQTAFKAIAPLSAGRVDIAWREVPCAVSGDVSYEFRPGSSQYYAAIQVRDARYRITKFEAAPTGTGAYQPIDRVIYNYFVKMGGLGPGPYDFRTTDSRGHVIEDTNITLGDGVVRAGSDQFPTCAGD